MNPDSKDINLSIQIKPIDSSFSLFQLYFQTYLQTYSQTFNSALIWFVSNSHFKKTIGSSNQLNFNITMILKMTINAQNIFTHRRFYWTDSNHVRSNSRLLPALNDWGHYGHTPVAPTSRLIAVCCCNVKRNIKLKKKEN